MSRGYFRIIGMNLFFHFLGRMIEHAIVMKFGQRGGDCGMREGLIPKNFKIKDLRPCPPSLWRTGGPAHFVNLIFLRVSPLTCVPGNLIYLFSPVPLFTILRPDDIAIKWVKKRSDSFQMFSCSRKVVAVSMRGWSFGNMRIFNVMAAATKGTDSV